MTDTRVSTLRSHLVADLKSLPGSSNITLNVLVSQPRKCTGLFPHTSISQKNRPKVLQQDYLILVSQSPANDSSTMCLTSAVEAVLYSIPSTHASLVYISKVDSTGQVVPGSGSPTAVLAKSLLRWFTQSSTRPSPLVRIQLFARAQNQYLFPNSSLHSGKRVLTDVKLCRWWKDVLTDLVEKHQEGDKAATDATAGNPAHWRCFYLFPGLSLMEAEYMLKNAKSNGQPETTTTTWVYSHSYASPHARSFGITSTSTSENSSSPESPLDIFDHIPTFSDDPKARFLHELAATDKAEANAPARKKLKARHSDPTDQEDEGEGSPKPTSSNPKKEKTPSISQDEFWERMTFRQECSSGAVTGFFTVDLLTPVPSTNETLAAQSPSNEEEDSTEALASTTPEVEVGCIPAPMVARIMASLGNLDFGSTEKATHASQLLAESIKGLCNGLAENGTADLTASPTKTAEGLDYYSKYIAASFTVNNPPLPTRSAPQEGSNGASSAAAAPAVNVLQVRKKKRPAA